MKKNLSPVLVASIISIMAAPAMAHNAGPNLGADMPPANARPGQCYARVLVPAQYRNVPIDVVTQDAVDRVDVTDPVFQLRPTTFVTRDGYVRYEVSEPVFRNEAQTIVTRPAYEKLEAVQAQMGTRSETITIREPRMVWRRGENLSSVRRIDPNNGEIYCLVEERGVTQTVTRRVVTQPASVRRVVVPAQTQVLNRQVLVTPAAVREVRVPETTQTVQVQEMVTPAGSRVVTSPEQHSTINRQELVAPEHYEWVEVDCNQVGGPTVGTNVAPAVAPNAPQIATSHSTGNKVTVSARSLQRELAQRGLYRGPIDGIYGPATRAAVATFQLQNNIGGNGQLNADTVRALGLAQ